MTICEFEKCTGCAMCVNICHQSAIKMIENEKGFLYPTIEEEKCVKCGLCQKRCPVNCSSIGYQHKLVYAALSKNDIDRKKSTSGGVFGVLAKHVLENGGYIYGASLEKDLVVRHIEVSSYEDLDKVRGSKYVQSQIGRCYQHAKERLTEGKKVLFSGTPCQIAGLRNFLKRDYPNLLTVDILCHGVPSPGLLKKYIRSEERTADAHMISILFRTKKIGWKKSLCERKFDNGMNADWGDTFVPGFLSNLYLRESCYSCQYSTDMRQGDITLGDYWGYSESFPEYIEDDDKGISLVIINTEKGKKALNEANRELALAKRTMENAKNGNPVLYKPCDKHDNYKEFWEDAKIMDWDGLKEKYITPQDTADWMSKELREYYDIPFRKRYRKHQLRTIVSRLVHKIFRK